MGFLIMGAIGYFIKLSTFPSPPHTAGQVLTSAQYTSPSTMSWWDSHLVLSAHPSAQLREPPRKKLPKICERSRHVHQPTRVEERRDRLRVCSYAMRMYAISPPIYAPEVRSHHDANISKWGARSLEVQPAVRSGRQRCVLNTLFNPSLLSIHRQHVIFDSVGLMMRCLSFLPLPIIPNPCETSARPETQACKKKRT